ncbi:GAF domain-containing protein [Cryobacterium sp. TMT1-21]|uniref:GAF domain-containing protein n=1 Tax=Cryobacterium shii TaxID=1259235 RepID=A0AAQ2C683_9MICO|nr:MULTISPECIES: GAF domain-containing protein [Cryobacterium]TFC47086.1 GAF domain-containing protein [Cryobacterium shii]TFC88191.1 GAF domain-containing protein [Cryobacterium sp. TmT2-59]TFD13835.1 GAF domain-containing protein [Cryobacterium sp. TMT1-21]TFD37940.1 GAF domain-containing protein [Cryobacterium sp. TMT2-10]
MPELIRWVLVPLMRAWSAATTRDYAGIPRPTDGQRAHSPGINSDRILIFGSGPAVGWGVLSHDVALPGSLARALSARTGRGTDVDVVPNPHVTIRTARAELDGLGLWRYDAIVVSLGTSDAVSLIPARVWQRELTALLDRIELESSLTTRIFVLGVQPIRSIAAFDSPLGAVAEKNARSQNDISAWVCSQRPQAHFVPMTANLAVTPGRVRTAAHYSRWAELLAARMGPSLDAEHLEVDTSGNGRSKARDAEQRSPDPGRAIDRLGILEGDPDARLDRIVAIAKRSYGTASAALTFIDGDRLWDKTNIGRAPRVFPLAGSITAIAVSEPGATVVPDAQAEERFRDHPLVTGAPQTRFYAGFPIEADTGERIGVLSVFDPEPRPAADIDIVLLRELALLIQAELGRLPD